MKEFEVTLYVVGDSPEDAWDCMPFDDYVNAEQFQWDNDKRYVYSLTAFAIPDSLELISENEMLRERDARANK